LPLEPRPPAKQPERDAGDLDAVATSDDRMRQFMRQQACIEKDGAHRSDDPVENGTVARGSDGEDVGRKRPRDKREDEDEAPVESNLDPEHSPDADDGIQGKPSLMM